MTEELTADFGYIYEWEHNNTRQLCVVISSPSHAMHNIISVLFLKPYVSPGDDVVVINLDNKQYCVRADFVTYTQRACLVQKRCQISKSAMQRIQTRIAATLNLIDRREVSYEEMYNDLLDMVVKHKESDYVNLISD